MHVLNASDTVAVTQRKVTLTLIDPSVCDTADTVSPARTAALQHSVSSPVLQGVWGTRQLEHALPPLDNIKKTGMDDGPDLKVHV